MPSGFRIASAYVDAHLDRTALSGEMADLDRQLQSDTDRIGKSSGQRLGKGLGDGADGSTVGKKIGDDVDRELQPRAQKSGSDSGDKLSQGMRLAVIRNSPVIAAAVGGGLAAGAPVVLAGAALLFAGIAAVAVHNNEQVQAAFTSMKATITSTFTDAAQVTVPMFTAAMARIGSAVQALGPQLHSAFAALGGPIDSLTTGLISMAQNAMPGLVAAVRSAGPVFQGLASLMGSIGTGLGQFFQIISQHAGAAGSVFSSLGSIVGSLLPILGQLVGVGAELASQILPPFAAVLHAVASALSAVAPILPIVAAGFLAFKAVGALSGPLGLLSAKLQTVAADSEGMASKMSGAGASAVSKLSGAVTGLSIGLGLAMAGFEAVTQQADTWASALNQGGVAAEQAKAQMHDISGYTEEYGGTLGRVMGTLGMFAGAQQAANLTSDAAKAKAKDQTASLSPLERAQQDVTKATNDYLEVLADPNHTADQAAAASANVASKQGVLTGMQGAVKAATEGATTAQQANLIALQGISDKASAANTQIQLLKGALDALTGKAVSADEAQIAVTQAMQAATTATQGQTGALINANGEIDLNTQKGAAASQALINLSSAGKTQIATLEQLGWNSADVSAKSDQLRAQFITVAQQMGFTAAQAQDLANRYYGIPDEVHTNIQAYDNASPTILRVQSLIAGLHDKNIFITTYSRVVSTGPAGLGGAAIPQAMGGIVHAFAGGGMEPMAANLAQTVRPGTLRVIGDNPMFDEAYIPINTSPRSVALWKSTGERMGLLNSADQLTGASGGSAAGRAGGNTYNLTVQVAGTVDFTQPGFADKIAVPIRDAIVKLERSTR